jgi:uncharacterized protein involved in response to NO
VPRQAPGAGPGGMEPLPMATGAAPLRRERFVLWSYAFRPFFLLVAIEGCGRVLLWLAMLHGWLPAPQWVDPVLWHAHEMLFGFVAAAIAGFLLTAVPTWTQSPPVSGAPLAALAGLWLAGRVAMAGAGHLPAPLVAAADLAFPAALAVAVARPILRARAWRNAGIVAALLLLLAADAASQLDALGLAPGAARRALHVAILFVAILILVIGGRITPAFTQGALQRAGRPEALRRHPALDRIAIAAAVALALAEAFVPRSLATGAVAAVASLATAGRMVGWRTRLALRDPLLGILHVGHAWVAVGFGLVALADLGAPVPATAALHALTAGAMGTMILAVASRVALGHTGRPLVAPPSAVLAYGLVNAGAVIRVLGPMLAPGALVLVWSASGVLWSAAFAVFGIGYARVLVGPRVDGRPG